MKPIVGIGTPIDYMGMRWIVSAITRTHVVLSAAKNPSRTTRVEHGFIEKAIPLLK